MTGRGRLPTATTLDARGVRQWWDSGMGVEGALRAEAAGLGEARGAELAKAALGVTSGWQRVSKR